MANWSPLRSALATVDGRVTFAWPDLDELVGGLPNSAYRHSAFWKGDRSGWPGFSTADVRVGQSVTFVRRSEYQVPGMDHRTAAQPRRAAEGARPDVVLVGCVKSKLDRPAPARDLYTSSLFRKERAHAEACGVPWFVLSAEHGLVAPATVLAPYDCQLSAMSHDYRRTWGARVVVQLMDAVGSLAGMTIEVHAGSAYSDAIRDRLRAEGAEVTEPLDGLTMGERLAWYSQGASATASPPPEASALVEVLGSYPNTVTPAAFLATGGAGLRRPGLYSWWADVDGAATLTVGLGHVIQPGLIYAGLAGATRSRSGRRSTNTLWGRIRSMHLGGRHELSTFRLSLGSILANAHGETGIDEDRLTAWMHEHLRLITVPVDDADALNGLETAVLADLSPPLNIDKMPRNPTRAALTELRRRHGRKPRAD